MDWRTANGALGTASDGLDREFIKLNEWPCAQSAHGRSTFLSFSFLRDCPLQLSNDTDYGIARAFAVSRVENDEWDATRSGLRQSCRARLHRGLVSGAAAQIGKRALSFRWAESFLVRNWSGKIQTRQ
jgi:hypothetical protein